VIIILVPNKVEMEVKTVLVKTNFPFMIGYVPYLGNMVQLSGKLFYVYIYNIQGVPRVKVTTSGECSYVKIYRYNPKHLCPKLNGYGDNGQRKVLKSCISAYCTSSAVSALTLTEQCSRHLC